ncbi:MAG: pyrimidine 5'-nucleotidase [Anaerolineales bacterium]
MPITHLLFDLDGTLYPHNNGIWDAIASRMEDYMYSFLGLPREEIPSIRENYYHQYGTTLKGLLIHHNIDPYQYLDFVHAIPLDDYIKADQRLRQSLEEISIPRWIFTNADTNHAKRVLDKLGISDQFEGILSIDSLDFLNKPEPVAFQAALKALHDPDPQACILIDDIPKNLISASKFGLHTILVGSTDPAPEINQCIPDIYQIATILDQVIQEAK